MRWRCPPELRGIAVAETLELNEMQQLVDALADLRPRPPSHLESKGDVVAHRHVLERGVVLEDEADVALLRRERRCVLPGREDLAGVGCLQPRDDAQQCRLPEPLGPSSAVSAALHLEETSSTATKSPKRFVMLRTVIDIRLRALARSDHRQGHEHGDRHQGEHDGMAYAPARSKLS